MGQSRTKGVARSAVVPLAIATVLLIVVSLVGAFVLAKVQRPAWFLETVATDLHEVSALAVDEDQLWIAHHVERGREGCTQEFCGDPVLTVLSVHGGSRRQQSMKHPGIRQLLIDASRAYASGQRCSSRHRCSSFVLLLPREGGPEVVIADGQDPFDIAHDGEALYWIDAKAAAVMRRPKAGGVARVLATGVGRGLVVVGEHVFFTEPTGKVRRVKSSGGESQDVADGVPFPSRIYAAGDQLYVSCEKQAQWCLFRVPIDGGPPLRVAMHAHGPMTVGKRAIYFIREDDVWALSHVGGEPFVILRGVEARRIALGRGVLFADDPSGRRVVRVKVDDEPP